MAITLNSGFKMPLVGLGVWRVEGREMKDLIINAIKIGYRHFDCAGTLFSHKKLVLLYFSCGGSKTCGSITPRLVGYSISFVLVGTCKSETRWWWCLMNIYMHWLI